MKRHFLPIFLSWLLANFLGYGLGLGVTLLLTALLRLLPWVNEDRMLAPTELLRIGKRFSIELLERPLPSDEDVEKVVSERIITLLEARLRNRDRLQTERMQRFLPLARSLEEGEEEAGLLAMLLDDFYQETFHAPTILMQEDGQPEASPGGKSRSEGRRRSGRSRGKPR